MTWKILTNKKTVLKSEKNSIKMLHTANTAAWLSETWTINKETVSKRDVVLETDANNYPGCQKKKTTNEEVLK